MDKYYFTANRYIWVDEGELKGKIFEVFAVDNEYFYVKSQFKNSISKIPCDLARLIPKECKPIPGDLKELSKKGIDVEEHIKKHIQ
jgi:hypothetical protein